MEFPNTFIRLYLCMDRRNEKMRKKRIGSLLLVLFVLHLIPNIAFGKENSFNHITKEDVAAAFPGYTLRSFGSYNPEDEVYACYSRIDNGKLYVKRAIFFPHLEQPIVSDLSPVPLSHTLLERINDDDFDSLLSIQSGDSLFKVEDALNTGIVPVTNNILAAVLQAQALILLTEDAKGIRYIEVVTETDGEYMVSTSPKMPDDLWLDASNSGEGGIFLTWNDLDHCAIYTLHGDGNWYLNWAQVRKDQYFDFSVLFFGVCDEAVNPGTTDGIAIGSFINSALLEARLDALPGNQDELCRALNREHWAVVHSINESAQSTLYESQNSNSTIVGEIFTGTPVQILGSSNEWCQVMIGLDGNLTGWMNKNQLVFGDDMDNVSCRFPQKVLMDEYDPDAFLSSNVGLSILGDIWIIGTIGDEYYVILSSLGETAIAPQKWFWDGRG